MSKKNVFQSSTHLQRRRDLATNTSSTERDRVPRRGRLNIMTRFSAASVATHGVRSWSELRDPLPVFQLAKRSTRSRPRRGLRQVRGNQMLYAYRQSADFLRDGALPTRSTGRFEFDSVGPTPRGPAGSTSAGEKASEATRRNIAASPDSRPYQELDASN
jgi:hypothetical protein